MSESDSASASAPASSSESFDSSVAAAAAFPSSASDEQPNSSLESPDSTAAANQISTDCESPQQLKSTDSPSLKSSISPPISSESRISIVPNELYLISIKFPRLADSPAAAQLFNSIFLQTRAESESASNQRFIHFTVTEYEISLLVDSFSLSHLPPSLLALSPGVWRAIQILEGAEILDLPGVVSSLCAPLASSGFELLYVSQHHADLILVKADRVDEAFQILSSSLTFLLDQLQAAEKSSRIDEKELSQLQLDSPVANPAVSTPADSLTDNGDGFEVSLSRSTRSLSLLSANRSSLNSFAFVVMKALLFPYSHSARPFFSFTELDSDLSIVCDSSLVADFPSALVHKFPQRWNAIQLSLGSVGFDQYALVAPVSKILAQSGVSIYFLSTFDTDFVLVRESEIDRAMEVLKKNLNVLVEE